MKTMGMQVAVNASNGTEFYVLDIFKEGSDIAIDVCAKDDYDNFANDMPVISLADLKDNSLDDRRSFLDVNDYKGEHSTLDNFIEFDDWIEDIDKNSLIEYIKPEIVSAIDEAIRNKVL